MQPHSILSAPFSSSSFPRNFIKFYAFVSCILLLGHFIIIFLVWNEHRKGEHEDEEKERNKKFAHFFSFCFVSHLFLSCFHFVCLFVCLFVVFFVHNHHRAIWMVLDKLDMIFAFITLSILIISLFFRFCLSFIIVTVII